MRGSAIRARTVLAQASCIALPGPVAFGPIRSGVRHRFCDRLGNGTIGAGMIPKVEACLESLGSGVGKTHMIDGRIRHSLLLEIYTARGIGTEIVL